jgi:hypothetical protein
MAYVGSYLWQLRQAIGHELALMPGAYLDSGRFKRR